VIGAIDNKWGRIRLSLPTENVDGPTMAKFVKELVKCYPNEKHALFIDNAPSHRSKEFKAECAWWKVWIIWNVPYKPEFNGIEKVWHLMKRKFR
jgi:Transposase and inactivated derivatives